MNLNNFTIKSQEAINKAFEIASANQQQAIETGHLLKGILLTDDNISSFILKKSGINSSQFSMILDRIVDSYPKVSGGEPYLSRDGQKHQQRGETIQVINLLNV